MRVVPVISDYNQWLGFSLLISGRHSWRAHPATIHSAEVRYKLSDYRAQFDWPCGSEGFIRLGNGKSSGGNGVVGPTAQCVDSVTLSVCLPIGRPDELASIVVYDL